MKHDVGIGAFGIGGPTMGLVVSAMPEIEAWLRVLSLIVGIASGIAGLWLLVKRIRKDSE